MAMPLPEGKLITVQHRIRPADYRMPSLEIATDHYSLSYLIRGDRTTITPTMTYTLHPGNVSTLLPYIYHRTVPASNEPYENIHIKFAPAFVDTLTRKLGEQFLLNLYQNTVNRFDPETGILVKSLFDRILFVYEHPTAYSEYMLECLLCELLILIAEKRLPDDHSTVHPAKLSTPILEAVYYMETHYAQPLKINEVAHISGYSVAYFSKIFYLQLGRPFSEYLRSIRIRNAQQLLLHTDKSVSDIAYETGYQYATNMITAFKKETGMTPHQFRATRY